MSRFFDNNDDSLVFEDKVVSSYPFTITGWANSNNLTAAQHIAGVVDKSESNVGIRLAFHGNVTNDPVSAEARNTGITRALTTTPYTTNTWHHAAATFVGDTERNAFKDGGSKGTDTGNSTFNSNQDRTSIGRQMRSVPGNPWDGELAYIGFWNVELSDNEILALASGVNPFILRNDALVAYYPVDGNESPEPDYVSQQNMTVNGAVKANVNPPVELLENYI